MNNFNFSNSPLYDKLNNQEKIAIHKISLYQDLVKHNLAEDIRLNFITQLESELKKQLPNEVIDLTNIKDEVTSPLENPLIQRSQQSIQNSQNLSQDQQMQDYTFIQENRQQQNEQKSQQQVENRDKGKKQFDPIIQQQPIQIQSKEKPKSFKQKDQQNQITIKQQQQNNHMQTNEQERYNNIRKEIQQKYKQPNSKINENNYQINENQQTTQSQQSYQMSQDIQQQQKEPEVIKTANDTNTPLNEPILQINQEKHSVVINFQKPQQLSQEHFIKSSDTTPNTEQQNESQETLEVPQKRIRNLPPVPQEDQVGKKEFIEGTEFVVTDPHPNSNKTKLQCEFCKASIQRSTIKKHVKSNRHQKNQSKKEKFKSKNQQQLYKNFNQLKS